MDTEYFISGEIEWAGPWPWHRCKARFAKRSKYLYWGRCDRVRNHERCHALERGMEIFCWNENVWYDTPTLSIKE